MKKIFLLLFALAFISIQAQEKVGFQLSSHILDISEGKPAKNVDVELQKYNLSTKKWEELSKKKTDLNGRIPDFLPYSNNNHGVYRLRFLIEDYFKNKKVDSFYPFIEVVFQIKDNEHYHVPITLSEFGYSTYRGS